MGFEKLNNFISQSDNDTNIFLVNGEWSFRVPEMVEYEIDGTYHDRIDNSYEAVPMLLNDYGSFYFRLTPHTDLLGKYYTVLDCRYDERFLGSNDNDGVQYKIKDDDDLYVDIVMQNIWPMGYLVQIRIRGENIDPYDFTSLMNAEDVDAITDLLFDIANSIKLSDKIKNRREGVNFCLEDEAVDLSTDVNTDLIVEIAKALVMDGAADMLNEAAENGNLEQVSAALNENAEYLLNDAVNWLLNESIDSEECLDENKSVGTEIRGDYIIRGTVLIKYTGTDKYLVLPEGITEIAPNTFSGRDEIKRITIPEGVEIIGDRAFENCFDLEEAILPSTLRELGGYAFTDCHKLKHINLNDNIKAINDSIFSECYDLENIIIPKGTKYIDNYAFKNCRKLKEITLPEGVEEIGIYAFSNCQNLEYIYIPASVKNIRDLFPETSVFEGSTNLTVHCPDGSYVMSYCRQHGIKCVSEETQRRPVRLNSDHPSDVDSINWTKLTADDCDIEEGYNDEYYLEHYFGNDKHIILPDGIIKIGDYAFILNESLESVIIPEGVTEIADGAFNGCKKLSRLYLPSSLETIGELAFYGCDCLKEVIIPEGVTEIADSAFNGCKKLSRLYLPSSLETIGESAFSDCDNLKEVVIPEGVTEIADGAFNGCKKLSRLYLPSSLETIGELAFYGCDCLKEVIITEGVTEIEDSAFARCESLTDIYIPKTVICLGCDIFWSDDALTIHTPKGSAIEAYAIENGISYDNNMKANS